MLAWDKGTYVRDVALRSSLVTHVRRIQVLRGARLDDLPCESLQGSAETRLTLCPLQCLARAPHQRHQGIALCGSLTLAKLPRKVEIREQGRPVCLERTNSSHAQNARLLAVFVPICASLCLLLFHF